MVTEYENIFFISYSQPNFSKYFANILPFGLKVSLVPELKSFMRSSGLDESLNCGLSYFDIYSRFNLRILSMFEFLEENKY